MLRTHFIIKPRIQIKYLLLSIAIVGVTALALYYVFWSALVHSTGLEQLSAGDWRALQRAYTVNFVWVAAILVVAIGLESIFLFHRLLGPVFVLEKIVRKLSGGDLTLTPHFRKHDELKDLMGELETMITRMKEAALADRKKAEEIRTFLERGDIARAKEELPKIASWYKID